MQIGAAYACISSMDSSLTKQGGGVAEVEVQGNAALLRGEGALPLQVRLPRVVPRKAQRLGHHIPLAVPAHSVPFSRLRHLRKTESSILVHVRG